MSSVSTHALKVSFSDPLVGVMPYSPVQFEVVLDTISLHLLLLLSKSCAADSVQFWSQRKSDRHLKAKKDVV